MKSQQIEAAAKKAISKFFDSSTMKGHQNPNGSQKLFQKKIQKIGRYYGMDPYESLN